MQDVVILKFIVIFTWVGAERTQVGSASGCHVETAVEDTQTKFSELEQILKRTHPYKVEVISHKLTWTRMRGLWVEGNGTFCMKWEMCLWVKNQFS